MRKTIITFFALVLISVSSGAVVFGGSNLGIMGYPDHDCMQPYGTSSRWKVEEYRDCIEEYVENARNDAERAYEAANDAVQEFNTWAALR